MDKIDCSSFINNVFYTLDATKVEDLLITLLNSPGSYIDISFENTANNLFLKLDPYWQSFAPNSSTGIERLRPIFKEINEASARLNVRRPENMYFVTFATWLAHAQQRHDMRGFFQGILHALQVTLNRNQFENINDLHLKILENRMLIEKEYCSGVKDLEIGIFDHALDYYRRSLQSNEMYIKQLKTLDLACLNIRRIPDEIKLLSNLTTLKLSGNPALSDIPYKSIPKVKELMIGTSQISSLPEGFDLPELEIFSIGKSPIDKFPDSFKPMRLNYLSMIKCSNFKSFPFGFDPPNLKMIDLTDTKLEKLPVFTSKVLNSMCLRGTGIAQLPLGYDEKQFTELLRLDKEDLTPKSDTPPESHLSSFTFHRWPSRYVVEPPALSSAARKLTEQMNPFLVIPTTDQDKKQKKPAPKSVKFTQINSAPAPVSMPPNAFPTGLNNNSAGNQRPPAFTMDLTYNNSDMAPMLFGQNNHRNNIPPLPPFPTDLTYNNSAMAPILFAQNVFPTGLNGNQNNNSLPPLFPLDLPFNNNVTEPMFPPLSPTSLYALPTGLNNHQINNQMPPVPFANNNNNTRLASLPSHQNSSIPSTLKPLNGNKKMKMGDVTPPDSNPS